MGDSKKLIIETMCELFEYNEKKCQKFDIDSYELVELLIEFEKKCDIVFAYGEWEDVNSLESMAELLDKKLNNPL